MNRQIVHIEARPDPNTNSSKDLAKQLVDIIIDTVYQEVAVNGVEINIDMCGYWPPIAENANVKCTRVHVPDNFESFQGQGSGMELASIGRRLGMVNVLGRILEAGPVVAGAFHRTMADVIVAFDPLMGKMIKDLARMPVDSQVSICNTILETMNFKFRFKSTMLGTQTEVVTLLFTGEVEGETNADDKNHS